MKKVLPILGVVFRLIAILLMLGLIGGVGYVVYYYAAPLDAPRPIIMKDIYKDMLIQMLPYQRAAPPMPTATPNPNPEPVQPAPGQPTPQGSIEGTTSLLLPALHSIRLSLAFDPQIGSG